MAHELSKKNSLQFIDIFQSTWWDGKRRKMLNGLEGQNQLDKRRAPGHIDIFTIQMGILLAHLSLRY
jgi:hypothetical protein